MSGLSDPLGSSGESVRVGSLKANAGHAEASAGAAGLTKLVLEADKQRVASNAQLRAVNMHVDQVLCGLRAAVVFAVQRSAIKEPILCGGVSSFGYSGTIAHAILFARGDQAPMQTSYTYKRQAFPWRTPPHLSAQCKACHDKRGAVVCDNPSTSALESNVSAQSLEVMRLPDEQRRDRDRNGEAGPRVQLLVSVGGVATLQLNDTAHFNAIGADICEDMRLAVDYVRLIPVVIGVVLQGAGPHFCIGANPYASNGNASMTKAGFVFHLRQLYVGFLQLRTLAYPVTCAVHGTLVGGAFAASLHADFLAAEHTSIFEHGNLIRGVCVLGMLSQTFASLLGAHAQHVYLQNAQLNAVTAHALGLVQQLKASIDATKRHAHEVVMLASQQDALAVALRNNRAAIDEVVLVHEAVGHAECQLSRRGRE
jgi:enoyl-CoA hydratase/carnithine racemase